MKFTQLARSLREEGLKNFYLIEGDEAYFRDHAVSSIREACKISQPMLNDVRCEGDALKGERLGGLSAELFTLPFFDEKRLVRIYEFYPSEREWEALRAFSEAPCPTTVLLIVNAGGKKGVDLKRKKGVVYVDCKREDEETLAKWLNGAARRAGLSVDGEAAMLFVRYCNLNAARMSIEIKKLRDLLGEGGRITRETVEEYVAKDVEYRLYELTNAAARRDRSAFSEILHDLLEKGYDENAALSVLVSFFRTLSEIADMRAPDAEIMETLGIGQYPLKKNREALARLGKERAKALYGRLYRLSADMRGGILGKAGALEGAVAEIFFG